jgi:LysM repeat protein
VFAKVLLLAVAALIAWAVVVRASEGARREHIYVVRPYDTLWTIASQTYAGDVREGVWKLERRNHLAGATIVPGEKLVVPGW